MQINYLPKNAQVTVMMNVKRVSISILKFYYTRHLPALLFITYLKSAPQGVSAVDSLIVDISCFNFKF